jgi:hypothetical protein
VKTAYWLQNTGADCGCGGCDPTAGDRPCPTCACCDAPADLAVPLAGWTAMDGSHHAVSYCGRCWRIVLAVRHRHAPPLVALPITRRGARLLPPASPASSLTSVASVLRQLRLFPDSSAAAARVAS